MNNIQVWFNKGTNGASILKTETLCRKSSLVFILSTFALFSFSQNTDSTKPVSRFATIVTLTNKGISTIPNLTLGKPAAIFEMSVGRKLSFEPQLRFSLEGKPWTFLFWWRYKLVNEEKFKMNIGVHPAIAFKTITDTTNDVSKDIIRADRYLAGELSPTLILSKNISVGMYYLYSHGLGKDIKRNTHLIACRISFSNVKLTDRFYIRFNPQVYYLNMDEKDGWYLNSTLTLVRRNFPLSVSVLANKSLRTEIPAKDDFLWNVSLIYTFSKEYVEK